MKTHAKQSIELDHLNLTPEAKTEVSNLIKSSTKRTQTAGSEESGTDAGTGAFAPHPLRREERSAVAIAAEIEQLPLPAPQQPKRAHAGRQPLLDHLPHIEHRHEPQSCQCKQCGSDLVKIGEDVSEQLDVKPAEFFVHRHIRPQYACRACETVVAEPVPPAVIDDGMSAPGLLTWITTAKYLDHLPLYRIAQIAARVGVALSLSTLAEWVGRFGAALQPLADRLILHLLQGAALHADETPVAQLDPGSGKTQRAYLWAYRSNDFELGPRIIVFDYQTSRSGKHARDFLDGWQGHLVVDDYGGYKALFSQTASPCTELGCWAHARRKFFDLHQANASTVAYEVLQRIGGLYAVENTIRPIALGKKNWLFTGSERAEKRTAAIQTLLGTAKLNGLNPAQWLTDTLDKLHAWPNSRIDELLPFAPEDIEALMKECG